MDNNKNFSESKASSSAKKCRGCDEVVPKMALYKLNRIAIAESFCSWLCLSMKLGYPKTKELIKRYENIEAIGGLQ